MLWFNDAVIEVLRQGVPLVTSITATAWGTARMASKGQSPKVRHVALYSGAGWLSGYVIRTVAMKIMEGSSHRALPGPSDMTMPEPMTTSGPMAGLPPQPPIGNQVGEVVAIPAPPKRQPTLVDVSARGENISVQGTMDANSMGSPYGG